MHFKIEGRNISPDLFTRYCMSFILGKEKSAEIQSAMDNREIIELLLLMTQNADLEKRMEMAHSPA